MKKTILIVAVMVSCFLFQGVQAFAGKVMDRILQKKELVVGTSGTQPPLTAKTKEGKLIGMDIDIANLMAEAMGVKLTLVEKEFVHLLPALDSGKIDMIISGMTMTPQRNLKTAFVGPYYISGKGVLTRLETAIHLDGPKVMNKEDFRVAALKGSTSQMFVENGIPKAKLVATNTLDQAIEMLLNKEVDALVADYPYCGVMGFRYRDQGLVAGKAPFTFEPLGIAIPPDDILLINWLENFLGYLQGTKTLESLNKHWFQAGPWVNELK